MRVLLNAEPFPISLHSLPWDGRGLWPCSWVGVNPEPKMPFVAAYRLRFSSEKAEVVRIHVTADERYELFLDGKRIARGSERGDANRWFFETYDLQLAAGEHIIVAQVSSLGDLSAFAQMTVHHGFLLCPQETAWQERIGTGKAKWEAKLLGGYTVSESKVSGGTGARFTLHADQMDWDYERGFGEGWSPAANGPTATTQAANDQPPVHRLTFGTLPAQMEQAWPKGVVRHVSNPPAPPTAPVPIRTQDDLPSQHVAWHNVFTGSSAIEIPPHSRVRVILDLEDYVCAYPQLTVSGGKGSLVRIDWEEALYVDPPAGNKGNRNEIEGKYFSVTGRFEDGEGDSFYPDGAANRKFEIPWWRCGRFVEVLVETKDDPLHIEALRFYESRYPVEMEAQFEASDRRFQDSAPIMMRTLQMCSHETYMDCPFYEQLQYIGDTRLQVLATFAVTHDTRLPRKALRMFDASRMNSGLTLSRYPSRLRQVIPPFSLWWVTMVHDYLMWRDDLDLVRELMPGVRAVLDRYRASIRDDGLLGGVEGWNFADWVPHWNGGVPPDGTDGYSAVLNYQAALAFHLASDLEATLGEHEMAQRHAHTCERIATASAKHFWDEHRGLLADDLSHEHWSEHTQCLALLVGKLSSHQRSKIAANLVTDPNLSRTTIYFSHYLFEAFQAIHRPDQIQKRLEMWFGLQAQGFKTTLESPEPSRSDCHAWGAHPLYHYFASFLGIRPSSPGFKTVSIQPQFGSLEWIRGQLPHPNGNITVELHQEPAGLVGTIELPAGVTGTLHHGGKTTALRSGSQHI
jgi:hypothetical protein